MADRNKMQLFVIIHLMFGTFILKRLNIVIMNTSCLLPLGAEKESRCPAPSCGPRVTLLWTKCEREVSRERHRFLICALNHLYVCGLKIKFFKSRKSQFVVIQVK